jgi:hypothetical protein
MVYPVSVYTKQPGYQGRGWGAMLRDRDSGHWSTLQGQKQARGGSEKEFSWSAPPLKPGAVVGRRARAVRGCHCATLIKEMGERSNAEQVTGIGDWRSGSKKKSIQS